MFGGTAIAWQSGLGMVCGCRRQGQHYGAEHAGSPCWSFRWQHAYFGVECLSRSLKQGRCPRCNPQLASGFSFWKASFP